MRRTSVLPVYQQADHEKVRLRVCQATLCLTQLDEIRERSRIVQGAKPRLQRDAAWAFSSLVFTAPISRFTAVPDMALIHLPQDTLARQSRMYQAPGTKQRSTVPSLPFCQYNDLSCYTVRG